MIRPALLLAAAVALAMSMPAEAQKKKPAARGATTAKKLYRWVDADGKVQVSDTLPPDQVGQQRDELNAGSGRTTATVARELTPEERATLAEEQARGQEEAERLAQQQRNEEAMLASYLTEDDLKRAYDERIGLLKQTLESTDVSLRALRDALALQLADASEAELQNKPVNEKRLGKIRELHVELVRQRQFQANRHVELLSLDSEYVRMLERYRLRRAEENAPPAAGGQPR
jgi:parvulin-like peptidyl-prolyl isomerase